MEILKYNLTIGEEFKNKICKFIYIIKGKNEISNFSI
jgi:hypothetical protein